MRDWWCEKEKEWKKRKRSNLRVGCMSVEGCFHFLRAVAFLGARIGSAAPFN